MGLSIIIVITILSLILSTQVLALFVQYRINRNYKGIGYWLLASTLMALGFICMTLVNTRQFARIAIIANPLLILGHLFFYVGIKRFFNQKTNKWILSLAFLVFNLIYYYYMLIHNSISSRTVVISLAITIISFMIAYQLFFKKNNVLSQTTNFIGGIFAFYGIVYMIRAVFTLVSLPVHSYLDQGYIIIMIIIISIVLSNLWTFGLIIMVNQSLNIENKLEKEKLQLMFNTSIDAQLITRLEDGLIIDVNDEFTILNGYSKAEVIGSYTKANLLWKNAEDRQIFIRELTKQGVCKNMEYVFKRKDKSEFPGVISARLFKINSITHIIGVIRDITERKLIESQMEKLVNQLEIEKNTAQTNAITDSLTGLFNRGYFDHTLRTEFFRLTRSGAPLSLIMLDIDHFKKFNDRYGHLEGDKCIQMIARMLKNTVERVSDIAARYGGEEFIAILPETGENGARIMGEKIRKGVEDLGIPHESSETAKYVTVSVGVVTVYPVELASPEQVLKLVDEALYGAKKTGRNRCVCVLNAK